MKARCMRCKEDKEMKDPAINKTARGGFMAKGSCPDCKCGMCKILSKDAAEKMIANEEAKKAF